MLNSTFQTDAIADSTESTQTSRMMRELGSGILTDGGDIIVFTADLQTQRVYASGQDGNKVRVAARVAAVACGRSRLWNTSLPFGADRGKSKRQEPLRRYCSLPPSTTICPRKLSVGHGCLGSNVCT